MNREDILEQLRAHRPQDQGEHEMWQRIEEFVIDLFFPLTEIPP